MNAERFTKLSEEEKAVFSDQALNGLLLWQNGGDSTTFFLKLSKNCNHSLKLRKLFKTLASMNNLELSYFTHTLCEANKDKLELLNPPETLL